MTKAELVAIVAARNDATQLAVNKIIRDALRAIQGSVAATGRFAWPGFGVWTKRQRKARDVVNPHTKVVMHLPKSSTVGFRPSKAFKSRL